MSSLKKNVIDDVNDRQLNSSSRHKDDQTPPAKYARLLEYLNQILKSCVVRHIRIDSSKRIGHLSLFMEVGIYHLPICSHWTPIMIVFMPIITFLLT